jgi:hypothetical protein
VFDDSEDDMDNFFDSDERSPNNREQGSEGRTGSSGDADNREQGSEGATRSSGNADNREQDSEGGTRSSGNADNLHGIQFSRILIVAITNLHSDPTALNSNGSGHQVTPTAAQPTRTARKKKGRR